MSINFCSSSNSKTVCSLGNHDKDGIDNSNYNYDNNYSNSKNNNNDYNSTYLFTFVQSTTLSLHFVE